MPKSLNFAQAAAVPIASLTAFQSVPTENLVWPITAHPQGPCNMLHSLFASC
jgi:hypothetical protein